MSSERLEIFKSDLTVTPKTREILLKVFRNHLTLYNQALKYLTDNPDISLKDFKKCVLEITSKFEGEMVYPSLGTEHYYLYRKHKKNIKFQKLVTSVQYLTFVVSDEKKFKFLKFDRQAKTVEITGNSLTMNYEGDLPELNPRKRNFVNIGYSSEEDKFKISVFCAELD